jgi:hypothetical protein
MLPFLRKTPKKLTFISNDHNNCYWGILGNKIYNVGANMTPMNKEFKNYQQVPKKCKY